MNINQTVQVFKALLEGSVSRFELAKRLNMCPKTIGRMLVALKAEKLIHVIGYTNECDGRNRVKIYTLGDGEDAQPQESRPQRVRSRKSYLKKTQAAKAASAPKIQTTFVGGKSLWQ